MPSVSILIPAYNAETTILSALDAAQSQTLYDIEILVIDDASKDRTAELVAGRIELDRRIQLLRCEVNGGPSVARNMGLRAARGEWIALLDADDVMAAERLERLLDKAQLNDVLVSDNLELYDLQAGRMARLAIEPRLIGRELRLDCEGFVARCQTNQRDAVDFGLLKPLMRRAHLLRNEVWYDERCRHGEDFRFYVDALLPGGSMLVLPEAYYRYTEPRGSISRRASGLSKTVTRFTELEAQTRSLAALPRYQSILPGLLLRAEAIHRLARVLEKMERFRQHSRFGQILRMPMLLADAEMRHHFVARLRYRFLMRRSAG